MYTFICSIYLILKQTKRTNEWNDENNAQFRDNIWPGPFVGNVKLLLNVSFISSLENQRCKGETSRNLQSVLPMPIFVCTATKHTCLCAKHFDELHFIPWHKLYQEIQFKNMQNNAFCSFVFFFQFTKCYLPADCFIWTRILSILNLHWISFGIWLATIECCDASCSANLLAIMWIKSLSFFLSFCSHSLSFQFNLNAVFGEEKPKPNALLMVWKICARTLKMWNWFDATNKSTARKKCCFRELMRSFLQPMCRSSWKRHFNFILCDFNDCLNIWFDVSLIDGCSACFKSTTKINPKTNSKCEMQRDWEGKEKCNKLRHNTLTIPYKCTYLMWVCASNERSGRYCIRPTKECTFFIFFLSFMHNLFRFSIHQ